MTDQLNEPVALLPCPHCGGAAECIYVTGMDSTMRAGCRACGVGVEYRCAPFDQSARDEAGKKAIAAWNRRACPVDVNETTFDRLEAEAAAMDRAGLDSGPLRSTFARQTGGLPNEDAPPIECRSKVGEDIALVDALITVMRQVAKVDLCDPQVQEALKDLFFDPATARVFGSWEDRIRRSEKGQAQNRINRARGKLWYGGPFRFRQDPVKPDHGISQMEHTPQELIKIEKAKRRAEAKAKKATGAA